MTEQDRFPLVAVDIGNTRLKFGVFERPLVEPLPHPQATLSVAHDWTPAELQAFLQHPVSHYHWVIASVNRAGTARLADWLAEQRAASIWPLRHTDLPVQADVEYPDRVGLDRLAHAVAANSLRRPRQPAIIIGMGTALTVDLVDSAGVFAGGAILPGVAISARALHEFTDLLPLVEIDGPPPAVGRSTTAAIQSGLYWGAVGAVRELVTHLSGGAPQTQIILTGGAGPLFAGVFAEETEHPPQFVPHLALAGIAVAAAQSTPAP